MLCNVMLAEKGDIVANGRVLFDSRDLSKSLVQKLFDTVHPLHMTRNDKSIKNTSFIDFVVPFGTLSNP